VGQPVRAPCELAPEEIEHIPWLRRRLLSWFARDGRTFPWRETGQDAVRGHCGGNAAAEDDRDRGRADLRRVRREFPLVGGSRAIASGGSRKRAQAIRALEAKGAGIPASGSVDRGAWGCRAPHARGIRAPAGHWPYTASAVLAIVYGRAEPLLDVNMARLLVRFLGSSEGAEQAPNARYTRSLFDWYAVNAASWSTGRCSISERSSAAPGAHCAPSARCRPGASMPGRVSPDLLPPQMLFRLTKRWWPMMMWSTSSMSRMRPASTSCKVVWISSGDGAGSPLGWLCRG